MKRPDESEEEYQKKRAFLESVGIDADKPYKPTIFAYLLRLFGLALVCSLVIGIPYGTFRDGGKWPLSLWGFNDVWGFFVLWLVWAGAAWGLWNYLFIEKEWKNPP